MTSLLNAKKKKNLLILIRELHDGGVGKVVCNLSSELAERWNVSIAYYREMDTIYPYSNKCSYYLLSDTNVTERSLLYRLLFLLRTVSEVRRMKRELDIDIALSMQPGSCLMNVLSKGKEQVICSERCNPKRGQGKYWLVKHLYRKADWIIFQSETVQKMFSRSIQNKSSILKNPVSLPHQAARIRTHRIVSLGRLVPQKNHALLIKSFAIFHKDHPDYTLSVYGEGELQKKLESLIEFLKLSETVKIEGNYVNVHEQISDAEIFVLSSDYEGLSNSLLEVMSMGIACISTRCEGSVDVIRDGENGLLVDRGDVPGLAHAMCRLADNEALRKRLEEQAVQDMKVFDKSRVAKEWEQLFLQVEGGQKP